MTPTTRTPFRTLAVLLLGLSLLAGCKSEPATQDETGQKPAAQEPAAPGDETAPGTEPAATDDEPQPTDDPLDAPASGHMVRTIPADELRADSGCKGAESEPCPNAPRTLPTCETVPADPMTLKAALDDRNNLVGQTITIRHPLSVSFSACTEMACDRQCCNTCHATILLDLPDGGSPGYTSLALRSAQASEEELWRCTGDESVVCCNTALPEGDVIVTGTMQSANAGFHLGDASVCVP